MIRLSTPGVTTLAKQLNKLTFSVGVQQVRTIKNPQNLPLQPVPKLSDTVEKYLKSVAPLLSPRELCQTELVLQDFCCPNGLGEQLQTLLEEKQKCSENWLLDWWLEIAYLGYRAPVVVHSSPGQVFPLQTFCSETAWLNYAAQIIAGAASYKTIIDKKQLPEEKMGNDPLDMNQYNLIFGTCRVPLPNKDSLQYNSDSKHIVVCHNNQFYQVQLFDTKECNMPSVKQLVTVLKQIVDKSRCMDDPVGILSGADRDSWAKAYQNLVSVEYNRCSIAQIQKSLFVVCLDQCVCPDGQESRKTLAGKQLIHGGGPNYNAGNRWFDKTIQFVISKDGICGLTYEHSPSEGQPVANMVDYINIFIEKEEAKKIPDNLNLGCEVVKLPFTLNDTDRLNIANAQCQLFGLATGLDLCVLTFTAYGKNFIKKQKLSPDSYLQMAFQYTYFRMYGRIPPQYESAALRKFLHGRTETIRSCSSESLNFACTMCSNAPDPVKAKALRSAIDGHKKYTVDALNGFGVDRHLLGLRMIAKQNCYPSPYIFEDVSFKRSTDFLITSSQVATKCDGFMCYGPTSFYGYGCCYNPRDDDMNIAVSCFQAPQSTNAEQFAYTLDCCLRDMKQVLDNSGQSKL
ncbi:carnitine O-acetyltransferase isoform X2 [Agrilus planipennis]|nr:carnitine O-acetyltransferase isoform X2 [Agrilus planipennis]